MEAISNLLSAFGLDEFVNAYDWVWPVCEILHFMGMAALIGTVGLVDLRILGFAKSIPIGQLERLVPVYQGSVNSAQVRTAEIFKEAVRANAPAIALAHNHPSGDPTPSADDIALTANLERAASILDIELLDHLIIGQGRWLSLRRLGLGFAPKGAR